jgi:hypothetical protein
MNQFQYRNAITTASTPLAVVAPMSPLATRYPPYARMIVRPMNRMKSSIGR